MDVIRLMPQLSHARLGLIAKVWFCDTLKAEDLKYTKRLILDSTGISNLFRKYGGGRVDAGGLEQVWKSPNYMDM